MRCDFCGEEIDAIPFLKDGMSFCSLECSDAMESGEALPLDDEILEDPDDDFEDDDFDLLDDAVGEDDDDDENDEVDDDSFEEDLYEESEDF